MTMKRTVATALSVASLVLAGGLACAAGQYGPGVSDTEIKIGNTMPYSGPASSLRHHRQVGRRLLRHDQ